MALLMGAGCFSQPAMTPELAQATVTAFAAQRTATAQVQTVATQAALATARAAEERRRAEEAAATATALARSTATPTATATPLPTSTPMPTPTSPPSPTPTSGPRYTAAAGGTGEAQLAGGSASFGFGIGKRPDGKLEGWLIYGSGRGTLRATEFTTVEVQPGTAGFWGFGFLSDQPERVSFNLVVRSGGQGGDGGHLRVVVYLPGGKEVLNEGGPVIRGSISVSDLKLP